MASKKGQPTTATWAAPAIIRCSCSTSLAAWSAAPCGPATSTPPKAGPPERVVAFYNQRGTAEQWIREGKNAVRWTRLSCRFMRANAVRLQLHALAYNMASFFRTRTGLTAARCKSGYRVIL
jgi:hypothetical protein